MMKNKGLLLIVSLLLCVYVYAQEKESDKVSPSTSLLQYGALGAIVLAMGGYIMFLHKKHSGELERRDKQVEGRDELLKDQYDKMNEKFDSIARTENRHIEVLTELKTLLKIDIELRKSQP